MKSVKIYTSPGCAYCLLAKQLFRSLSVSFEEIDLSENPQLAEELSIKHQWQTVPMIFIGDEFIGGYDDVSALHRGDQLMQMLE